MHHSYYFLRHLSRQLSSIISGWELATAFSQNKDELVLGFYNPGNPDDEFYIKAYLDPRFCCLHFPRDYKRSKRNSIDLFKNLTGKRVVRVHQFLNERSFALYFKSEDAAGEYALLFKMHGNRSNVLLFADNKLVEIFRSSLRKDENLDIRHLDRPLDQSYANFMEKKGDIKPLFPTFGPLIKSYLQQKNYDTHSLEEKWNLLQDTLKKLASPDYFYIIQRKSSELHLSLLEFEEVLDRHAEPINAVNDYFLRYIKDFHLNRERRELLKALEKKKSQAKNYIKKNRQKLHELQQGARHEEIANIIMANLHQIPANTEQVELLNLYTNQPIKIRLKKDLSPQKNAEVYYRKAKNQKLEIGQLEKNIQQKEEQLTEVESHLAALQTFSDVRELRQYVKEQHLRTEHRQQEEELPYRQFTIEGFVVLVGKNAKSNDTLIREYSWKEDLWLHAKDVSGSHVIIKHQAGKNYPKSVIEKAARLAAYYSKRKTESLCPVSVTPRKFVRKSKDLAPGQVIVDREETILVEPGQARPGLINSA